MLLLKHDLEESVMELFKFRNEIQRKQIEIIEQYLNYIRYLKDYEIRLNGQISNADLLLNDILKRTHDLDDESIVEEQRYVYERILLKRYAQETLSNNVSFNNIFRAKDIEEVEKRITIFLNKNRQLSELMERIEFVLDYVEEKDETK